MSYYATDQNDRPLYANVRRDADGTWSANVWSGHYHATTLRRYFGFRTRREAMDADISEIPAGGRSGEYSMSKELATT